MTSHEPEHVKLANHGLVCIQEHKSSQSRFGADNGQGANETGQQIIMSTDALRNFLARLPLEIVLHITSFLPRPQYNVLLSRVVADYADEDKDSLTDDSMMPEQRDEKSLLYRTFENELDALKDIYRLNSYVQDSGQCICCHSFDALRRLNFLVQNALFDDHCRGCQYSKRELDERTVEIVRREVKRQTDIVTQARCRHARWKRDTFELSIVNAHFEKRDMEWLQWVCRESEND